MSYVPLEQPPLTPSGLPPTDAALTQPCGACRGLGFVRDDPPGIHGPPGDCGDCGGVGVMRGEP